MLNTVFVAGYGNSIDGHWQEAWHKTIQNSHWVEQADWDNPDCSDWVEALDTLLTTLEGPILLVTHSLGGSTLVEWNKKADKHSANIVGALMVAVPDVHSDYFPSAISGYQDLPLQPLPFPSLLLASTDDPYATFERAEYFAKHWGSSLTNVGALGHINVASNVGIWPDGLTILAQFIKSIDANLQLEMA